jgi:2-hydroxychromene-2-carboxylate isomerase
VAESIDFYFDFSSPYGYLMSEKIEELAARHGRRVRWRPILLGTIFQVTGAAPLVDFPLKGAYSRHDMERTARFLDLPLRLPEPFPVATQHTARAYYWLHEHDCAKAVQYVHAAYRAYFVDGKDISRRETVEALVEVVGMPRAALAVALGDAALKARLREECDAAIARGVCGSPYLLIDGEAFWGVDRLPQIERWLDEGGF